MQRFDSLRTTDLMCIGGMCVWLDQAALPHLQPDPSDSISVKSDATHAWSRPVEAGRNIAFVLTI